MIDFAIEKLTVLLLKQIEKDKKGKTAYIKKVDAYNDLIKLLKEIKNERIIN